MAMVKKTLSSLVFAIAFVMVGELPAGAATSVPFSAKMSAQLIPGDGLDFVLLGIGKMNATHLGKISYSANGLLDSPNPTSDVLTETLTAANGDSITFRCEQSLDFSNFPLVKGTDSSVVESGTGRFAGASGVLGGSTTVDFSVSPPLVVKEIVGSISY